MVNGFDIKEINAIKLNHSINNSQNKLFMMPLPQYLNNE